MNSLKVALIQLGIDDNQNENLDRALNAVAESARGGANLVVLPEMFTCPYVTTLFPHYAEPAGGETWQALSQSARVNQVYLVGGSFPERGKDNKVYNTCFIFDPQGLQIGRHRKMHLFDISIYGKQTFRESETLSPGNQVTAVDTSYGKLGVCVCYDLRFPELARLMVQQGAVMLAVPGAFNMTTGPAHWEILFRARAVDNQAYIFGCAPARHHNAGYISYGNSIIVSPWGEVTGRLGAEEGILLSSIDLDYVNEIRDQLPLLKQRRQDLYSVDLKGPIFDT